MSVARGPRQIPWRKTEERRAAAGQRAMSRLRIFLRSCLSLSRRSRCHPRRCCRSRGSSRSGLLQRVEEIHMPDCPCLDRPQPQVRPWEDPEAAAATADSASQRLLPITSIPRAMIPLWSDREVGKCSKSWAIGRYDWIYRSPLPRLLLMTPLLLPLLFPLLLARCHCTSKEISALRGEVLLIPYLVSTL